MTPRLTGYLFALTFSALCWTLLIVSVANAAPVQWQLFALQHPAEAKPGPDKPLRYTDALMAHLIRINEHVNRSIKPKSEARDVWTLSPHEGDCDDYAVTKRHMLRKSGLNPGALRIAMVRTNTGEGHAVLVVMTTKGALVLDNLTSQVLPWEATGHRLHMMQTANPNVWGD